MVAQVAKVGPFQKLPKFWIYFGILFPIIIGSELKRAQSGRTVRLYSKCLNISGKLSLRRSVTRLPNLLHFWATFQSQRQELFCHITHTFGKKLRC